MNSRQRLHEIDRIGGWLARLDQIANEMEYSGNPQYQALSQHIDSIAAELEGEQRIILGHGPIVTFGNGTCAVRSATGN